MAINIDAGITWANNDADLCRHMVFQGHTELTRKHKYYMP